MSIRLGERCTTTSGVTTGMLVSIGRERATIRRDDGRIASVATNSIRRIKQGVALKTRQRAAAMPVPEPQPLYSGDYMPIQETNWKFYCVVEIATGAVLYHGDSGGNAAAALNPGTCYGCSDIKQIALERANERAAWFRAERKVA